VLRLTSDIYKVVKRYNEKVLKAFEIVKKDFPELETLRIFGELFGGGYPHKDVTPVQVSLISSYRHHLYKTLQ
jgi:hypothetical protein